MAVTKIGRNAFYQHPNLETVRTSATLIENEACYASKKLNFVELTSTSACNINSDAFKNCSKLQHFIIRSTSVSKLYSSSVLASTRLHYGDGGIYVPSNLVESYKTATNWSAFKHNIYPISEYPRTNFDSITDSWATILADQNPSSHYSLGDTKSLNIDGNSYMFQIVGFGIDPLASDNTKYAAITWLQKNIYCRVKMNSTNSTTGGWASSWMRSWLVSDVLPLLEVSDVGESLQTVSKTYKDSSNSNNISSDKIWIPSMNELHSSTTWYETSGPKYLEVLSNYSAFVGTKKMLVENCEPDGYWTRTVYDTSKYCIVPYNGGNSTASSSSTYGVVLGFCTGVAS